MPTLERVRQLADDFERDYPDSLPDQLTWWMKVLGVHRSRMLRLIGLTPIEIARAKTRDWPRLVHTHRLRAAWVEELLGQLLEQYSYDFDALSTELHAGRLRSVSLVARQLKALRPTLRRPRRLFEWPTYSLLSRQNSASTLDTALLGRIYRGGPEALKALRAFLSKP